MVFSLVRLIFEHRIYYFNTLNAVGCDSVATLNLNVNSPTESIETIESCDPYLWNGVLYDVSGQYTY